MKQCRICLEYKRNVCSVFERYRGISYANMISSLARIKILEDACRNSICLHCRGELRRAYDFIKQIERSDMVLNQHLKILSFYNFDDIKAILIGKCVFKEKQMNSDDDNTINKYIKNNGDIICYNNTTIRKVKSVPISNFPKSINHEIYETNDCLYEDHSYDDLIECNEFIREEKKTEKMQISTDLKLKGTKKGTKKCLSKSRKIRIKPIFLDNIRVIRTKYPTRVRNRSDKAQKAHKHRRRMNMCPHCGIMCGNLSSHMMVHTGERKYKCSECRKSFFTSKQLSNHQRNHSVDNTFKCDHCVAVFNNKNSLQSHMVSHTDDKNHVCLVCNKGFKRKHSLLRHTLIHNSAAKSVKCELCNMSFLYKQSLRNHMRVHTGERPFKCEICSQPYSYKHDFNRHCLKKHGVYLKRRSVHVMTEEVLKRERELMKDLMLRIQGVVKKGELSNPFQGPQAALAFEHAVKALGSSEINAIM